MLRQSLFVKKRRRITCKIGRGGVYVAPGVIFMEENLIFRKKNHFLADFAPGDFEEILAKSGEGGSGGGAELPCPQVFRSECFGSLFC